MEILKYGNLTLKENSKEIEIFDDQLISFANEMYEKMVTNNGIGLAAPQVGSLIQLIVIDIEDGNGRLDLVNPRITDTSDEVVEGEEGCLSVPGIYAKVMRFAKINVEAQNLVGETFNFQADEFLARVIQHEIDHLNGILFIDRVDEMTKKKFRSDLKKIKKKYNKILA
ncbi:MAG: peptide deformylase [Spirochaetota bacterium]|nr:peptide deformylase [Spirochaetota bacterium]